MNRYSMDLLLIDLVAIAAAIFTLTDSPLLILRAPFGILATLFVPGYALLAAILPERSPDWTEHVAFSVALSIAVVIVGGLLLFLVTRSLSPSHWVIFLVLLTLLASPIAAFRRARYAVSPYRRYPAATIRVQPTWPFGKQWLLYGLAILVVLGALRFAQGVASEYPRTSIVQMWMLPDQKSAVQEVRVGVMTSTDRARRFSLVVKSGGTILAQWPELVMRPDDRWEINLILRPSRMGKGPIEGFLYDLDDPAHVFRHVTLWTDPGSMPEVAR